MVWLGFVVIARRPLDIFPRFIGSALLLLVRNYNTAWFRHRVMHRGDSGRSRVIASSHLAFCSFSSFRYLLLWAIQKAIKIQDSTA